MFIAHLIGLTSPHRMFQYHYINHYYALKRFKTWFIKTCPVTVRYEANKIWAYWIIYNRSLWQQIDHFLPSVHIEQDFYMITLLVEKGATPSQALSFYNNVIETATQLTKFHYYLLLRHPSDTPFFPEVQQRQNKVILQYQSVKHVIHRDQYCKLMRWAGCGLHKIEKDKDTDNFCIVTRQRSYLIDDPEAHLQLWKMLNNYYLLEGYSYQWAVPLNVIHLLESFLSVPLPERDLAGKSDANLAMRTWTTHHRFMNTELFASPLNAYYPSYYSLFEGDTFFGSRGNVFRASLDDFLEGGFQVNPPFIDSLFIKTVEILLNALERAHQAERALLFVFFMPGWHDSPAYKQVNNNPYRRLEVAFPANNHAYFDYKEGKRVTVHFETRMIILSSQAALGALSAPQIVGLQQAFGIRAQ